MGLSSHTAGRNLKGLFDKGDAWYLGKCVVKDANGNKKGIVKFHQELTDAGELEPTSVSARVRGAGADRVSIGIYETDPNNLTGDDQMANLGEFRQHRGSLHWIPLRRVRHPCRLLPTPGLR